jgi:hypothetical protein
MSMRKLNIHVFFQYFFILFRVLNSESVITRFIDSLKFLNQNIDIFHQLSPAYCTIHLTDIFGKQYVSNQTKLPTRFIVQPE